MEEMLIIEPPPALRIAGMAYLVPRNTPLAFTSITRSHCSSVRCSMVTGSPSGPRVLPMPALFTSTGSVPKQATAVATACCQSSALVTSSLTKRHAPPLALISGLDLLAFLFQESPNDPLGTLTGKEPGFCSTLAPGPAANERHLAFESHGRYTLPYGCL